MRRQSDVDEGPGFGEVNGRFGSSTLTSEGPADRIRRKGSTGQRSFFRSLTRRPPTVRGEITKKEHAVTHHMLQDHPCRAWLRTVMREDDQNFGTDDDRQWWPRAYAAKAMEADRRPLFYLDEADPTKVTSWLAEYESWSRPTWIAVTTLFQSNSTVEAQLSQVGIAFEALGYALWRRETPVGGRTPKYERLLEHVTTAIGNEHHLLFGAGATADDWRRKFINVFIGAKHADNPLPDTVEALARARQAFMLIRCWLAVELGVQQPPSQSGSTIMARGVSEGSNASSRLSLPTAGHNCGWC
jgi:hypothetical protein